MDQRIDEIEKCNDGDYVSLMVHMHYGTCVKGDQGCHTFGADTLREVKRMMKRGVEPCHCKECGG